MARLRSLKFKGSKRTKGGARAKATKVLAQGAAQVATRALGGTKASIPKSLSTACWNAHSPVHAGLPRAVGPYTVVKTTKLITSKSPMLVFGSYASMNKNLHDPSSISIAGNQGEKHWTNICCIGASEKISVTDWGTAPISNGNHTEIHAIPCPGNSSNGTFAIIGETETTFRAMSSNTTAVPSAISVQIINPTAVMTAKGTSVAAVCPVRVDLCDSQKTWGQVADELLSYFKPRVLTGGKLALRGVQMDSLPLSMADVSDFRPVWDMDPVVCAPNSFHWSTSSAQQNIDVDEGQTMTSSQKTCVAAVRPEGWAPMAYYNPYNAGREPENRQEMSFLVTIEWRVRFDISNPASSSHRMHPPSTDSDWHQMIKKANAALPGVLDIVERVANTGLNVSRAYASTL